MTFRVNSFITYFALMLLHFVLVLHFVAIVITFCVSITFCGDYYILRRNKCKNIPDENPPGRRRDGKKAGAADVCSNIRAQRDGSGRGIFAKEEWLVADQIAHYFSRLSVSYRSGRLPLKQVNPDTTEDEEEDCVAEAEDITTRLEIHPELWSYNLPQLY